MGCCAIIFKQNRGKLKKNLAVLNLMTNGLAKRRGGSGHTFYSGGMMSSGGGYSGGGSFGGFGGGSFGGGGAGGDW